MKIKTTLCITTANLFFLSILFAQKHLPPLNPRCGEEQFGAVEVHWDSLENATAYQIYVDDSAGNITIDTTIDNSFSIQGLDLYLPLAVQISVRAKGKPGYYDSVKDVFCNKRICPREIPFNLLENQDIFCFGDESEHFLEPTINLSGLSSEWGLGNFSFNGLGIDSSGTLNVMRVAPGIHEIDIFYQKEICIYSRTDTIRITDPSPIEIRCIQDSFLNNLAIGWDRKPFASNYEIFINDSLIAAQSHVGFLYHPNFPGEEIDIKIQPIGSHGCEYAPGYLTCTAPDLTNSREFFEKEVVSVFPNPSSGLFEVFSEEKIERIEVFDFSGKKVKEVFSHRDSSGGKEIDLSEFESSVYFLKIHFKENVVLKKVIKI